MQWSSVDLIWNTTPVCQWDCKICCVDAVKVEKKSDLIVVQSRGLQQMDTVQFDPGAGSVWDQATAWRQARGLELTLAQKRRVMDHLGGRRVRIDISGGDPLAADENLTVLAEASRRFGRSQVTRPVPVCQGGQWTNSPPLSAN